MQQKYVLLFIQQYKMDENLYTIRERLLQFIETQSLSNRRFCEIIGVNHTFFIQKHLKSSLGSDVLSNILYNYPEINVDWLLSGKGEMIKKDTLNKEINEKINTFVKETNPEYQNFREKYYELLEENRLLRIKNDELKEQINKQIKY